MKVDEKCDVYSFGVLTLEIIMGRHPGDFISALLSPSSSSTSLPMSQHTILKDVLDQCIPPPEHRVASGVVYIAKLAFACLRADPQSRPTMKQVASDLSIQWPPLSKPFSRIELKDVLLPRNSTGWTFSQSFYCHSCVSFSFSFPPIYGLLPSLVIRNTEFRLILYFALVYWTANGPCHQRIL